MPVYAVSESASPEHEGAKKMVSTLEGKRVLVTGGAGFLGRQVVRKLRESGVTDVMVPRRKDYDLCHDGVAERLLEESRPDTIIHLAAVVGGIGANRANPGSYLYENLMMGARLIEASRKSGVDKFVCVGTICSYPKLTALRRSCCSYSFRPTGNSTG
jgi:GDP-L-fucose synthase